MISTNRRIGEKGQRTPRSTDVYKEKGGVKGVAHCRCGAVYRNKRWSREGADLDHLDTYVLVCPACRRIADRNPAGIVFLSGIFLKTHELDIQNLINNTVMLAVTKNTLGRVMEINKDNGGVTITTTDVKLAQKIGRELYKTYGGQLQYLWSHAEAPVRVLWSR